MVVDLGRHRAIVKTESRDGQERGQNGALQNKRPMMDGIGRHLEAVPRPAQQLAVVIGDSSRGVIMSGQERRMLVMMMPPSVGVPLPNKHHLMCRGCGAAFQRPRRLTSRCARQTEDAPNRGHRSGREYSGYRRKHVKRRRLSLTLSGDLPASSCTAARIQSRAICRKSSLSSSGSASVAQRRHSSANFLYS